MWVSLIFYYLSIYHILVYYIWNSDLKYMQISLSFKCKKKLFYMNNWHIFYVNIYNWNFPCVCNLINTETKYILAIILNKWFALHITTLPRHRVKYFSIKQINYTHSYLNIFSLVIDKWGNFCWIFIRRCIR